MIRSTHCRLTAVLVTLLVFMMVFSSGCARWALEALTDTDPDPDPTEPKTAERDPEAPSIGEGGWFQFGDLWAMSERFSRVEWHTYESHDAAPSVWGIRVDGPEVVQQQDTLKVVLYDGDGNEGVLWLGEEPGDYIKVRTRGQEYTGEMAEMFGGSMMMGPLGGLLWINQDDLFRTFLGMGGGSIDWEIESEGREQIGDAQFDVTRIQLTPRDATGLKETELETAIARLDSDYMIVEWTSYLVDYDGEDSYFQLSVMKMVGH